MSGYTPYCIINPQRQVFYMVLQSLPGLDRRELVFLTISCSAEMWKDGAKVKMNEYELETLTTLWPDKMLILRDDLNVM